MTNVEKLMFGVIALFAIGLVFICVDCSGGKTRYFECSVIDHRYEPEWTQNNYDGDGHFTGVTYHPAEWHVICQDLTDNKILDCNGSKSTFYSTTNSQAVTVRTRQGRFTGAYYLPAID